MDLKPRNLLKRVINFARGESGWRLPVPPLPRDVRAPEDGANEEEVGFDDAPDAVRGLEVAHLPDGGGLVLRWAIGPDDVARAGALVAGQPVLCLRVVSFSKVRDDVLREVKDRPNIELRGECEIIEPPQRAIVALGLRVGDRFVSIAHHVV
ncbi:MAG: hypothetical protein ABW252_16735 [Polyangiales bacterium]